MAAVLQVNGFGLDAVDVGRGVPVVFSHGSNSDVRYGEPQRAAFAAGHRFLAFTRRFDGNGTAQPADADNPQDAHADHLLAVLQTLKQPAHVVGFSTVVAPRAPLREPSSFRTLTLVEPNVPWVIEGTAAGDAVIRWWRDENDRVRREDRAVVAHLVAIRAWTHAAPAPVRPQPQSDLTSSDRLDTLNWMIAAKQRHCC